MNANTTHPASEDTVAPLLLSADRVAEALDVSVRTLWRLRAAGKLPAPVRVGGSIRWRHEDIKAWIDEGCPEDWQSRSVRTDD